MSRLYVYALTDSPSAHLRTGGRTIETVSAGGLYAAVARMVTPPPVSEEALVEQDAVEVTDAAKYGPNPNAA